MRAAARRGATASGLLLGLLATWAVTARAAELTGKVVDADGAPLTGAVVFVDELPAGVTPPAAEPKAAMDQVQKQFVPHVLPVVVGTAVTFPNHDQIHHHVYSFSRTKTFELPLYKGEDASAVTFDQPGAVKIGCNIHDWMDAVILVVPNAYHATTDDTGLFVLRDLPPGSYGVAAWHERQKGAPHRQTVAVAESMPPITMTLDVGPPRARVPARGGARSYE